MTVRVLGLDIGGANLKAASFSAGQAGRALTLPFPLWKQPAQLPEALAALLAVLPGADRLAVTMTGELCDCFAGKREGVNAILDAVARAAGKTPVVVWSTLGKLLSVAEARREPLKVASANWHALATFWGRALTDGPALLLDIGSTTTDIIPLVEGRPCPTGWTDPERLRSGELYYAGVRRTPLIGLMEGAAELFATTLDVFLLLDMVPQRPEDCDTADGRPATCAGAQARLARMLCGDLETTTEEERIQLARDVHFRLVARLARAVGQVARRLPGPPYRVAISGSGEFLARQVLRFQDAFPPPSLVSMTSHLGQEVSAAACAFAVAVLCTEREGG